MRIDEPSPYDLACQAMERMVDSWIASGDATVITRETGYAVLALPAGNESSRPGFMIMRARTSGGFDCEVFRVDCDQAALMIQHLQAFTHTRCLPE